MRDDKHIAIKLRKEGKSYNKISKELNIAKSTLSGWFSGLDWSDIIKQELARKANYVARKRLRLVNKQRREMWERWRQEHRDKAAYQFPLLKKNPLFLAGLMLYWGEGDSLMKNGWSEDRSFFQNEWPAFRGSVGDESPVRPGFPRT